MMNERIKELSRIADEYANDTGLVSPLWNEIFEEKFAELIIQECADYIEHFYGDFVAKEIGGDIKRHFGVEE